MKVIRAHDYKTPLSREPEPVKVIEFRQKRKEPVAEDPLVVQHYGEPAVKLLPPDGTKRVLRRSVAGFALQMNPKLDAEPFSSPM